MLSSYQHYCSKDDGFPSGDHHLDVGLLLLLVLNIISMFVALLSSHLFRLSSREDEEGHFRLNTIWVLLLLLLLRMMIVF